MANEHVDFEFTCPLCGGHTLELPENYNDNSMATCGSCGTDMARWGEIKAQVEAQKPTKSGPVPFKGFTRG
jgi:hypothetical protein